MNHLQFDFIDIHSLSDRQLNSTVSLMTERKRARVLGFANEDNRRRSIAAEFLARSIAAKLLSVPENEVIIDSHENGQPYISGLPCFVSLSHSGHLAMAAVSDRPIGADIEIITDRGARLFKKVCSFSEQEYILASGDFDPRRFFSVWTAKEAVLKHSGKGLSGGLASTIVADSTGLLTEINGLSLVSGLHDDAAYSIYY